LGLIKDYKSILLGNRIEIVYTIIDAQTFVTLTEFSGGIFTSNMQNTFQAYISSNINTFSGRQVIVKPKILGLTYQNGYKYALVHIYLENEMFNLRKSGGIQHSITISDIFQKEYHLYKNYPNPFNPVTSISYQLPKKSFVNLSVYNILGQIVTTLVNEEKEPGFYTINWDASKFSSGLYIYKIQAGKYFSTHKCLLLK